MVQKFIKFIEKSPHKAMFLRVIADIYHNNLESYDIKKISGKKDQYRIRKGSVRFIFKKTDEGNKIIYVGNRGDAY